MHDVCCIGKVLSTTGGVYQRVSTGEGFVCPELVSADGVSAKGVLSRSGLLYTPLH